MFAPSDYSFDLLPELIAQEPAAVRDASRLLHLGSDGVITDRTFLDLADLIPEGAVVVVNDTRVIPARVLAHKPTGGRVELLFLEPAPTVRRPDDTVRRPDDTVRRPDDIDATPSAWRCLARARRPLRVGQVIVVDGTDVSLELLAERADDGSVVVAVPGDALALLDRVGHVPLPRYIRRDGLTEEPRVDDRARYQTMFARVPGAVAAPTAGLHMTPQVVERLTRRGIALATVTLHVGYGTFAPVHELDVREHHMHRERYAVPEDTARLVASGRPVVALGTTALRALEASGGAAGTGTTELFIYPGSDHAFRVVDHLITNFHLPESTLLMLVCAFAGTARVLAAYRHAVAARYRFFSYGDAMVVHRATDRS